MKKAVMVLVFYSVVMMAMSIGLQKVMGEKGFTAGMYASLLVNGALYHQFGKKLIFKKNETPEIVEEEKKSQ